MYGEGRYKKPSMHGKGLAVIKGGGYELVSKLSQTFYPNLGITALGKTRLLRVGLIF